MPYSSSDSHIGVTVENVDGRTVTPSRRLAIHYNHIETGRAARVATATFTPPDAIKMGGYSLYASPTLYSGHIVHGHIVADRHNGRCVECRIFVRHYGPDDRLAMLYGPMMAMSPGSDFHVDWKIPDTRGYPIAEIGIVLTSEIRADGTVYLHFLDWADTPDVRLTRTEGGSMWRSAWVDGFDHFQGGSVEEPYRLIQDEGTGLLIQGCRGWRDYAVSAPVTPHMAVSAGIAACVQG